MERVGLFISKIQISVIFMSIDHILNQGPGGEGKNVLQLRYNMLLYIKYLNSSSTAMAATDSSF